MIVFDHVDKRFGEREILKDLSFQVERGEIFTLIGPSGSGKTTILRMIAMIENPSSGVITIMGKDTRAPENERVMLRRRMGMVFQKPVALRGNVFDNVALGLRFRGFPGPEISRRVSEALDRVGLPGYGERDAQTLSGGELQRVAIARVLATRPEILLLDEPTANLDPVATELIEDLIISHNEENRTTIVLSTHDMIQGQRLATRIAVVLNGQICQIGDPHQIFYQPGNRDVARMVGMDNRLPGTIVENEGGFARVDVSGVHVFATCPYPPGMHVTLSLRPEDIWLSTGSGEGKSSARNILAGTISRMTSLGPNVRVTVTVDHGVPFIAVVTRRSVDDLSLCQGTTVQVSFKASAVHVTRADTEKNAQ
ncbi:MAG: ABC transporter ATP-binding protein [Methanolinea sp.]|nr:ABC transporter ATP-binding protein [Methanolinea sp.]